MAFLNETAILTNDVRRYRHRDYDELTRTVRSAIPPGTTVFLAYPDVSPYFALVGRNRMRIAVPTPTSPHAHRDAAVESDYIVASTPVMYLPEVNDLLSELTPTAVIDQGPGFRLEVYRSPGPAER